MRRVNELKFFFFLSFFKIKFAFKLTCLNALRYISVLRDYPHFAKLEKGKGEQPFENINIMAITKQCIEVTLEERPLSVHSCASCAPVLGLLSKLASVKRCSIWGGEKNMFSTPFAASSSATGPNYNT
ncbi:hypothetical protein POVWA2_054980 [Plasmodium ovale wallikeri]|uniref:Uncharacterized protein n=1 Tax=Plasmodium ovale wallikeri TaxID=864142 RepID=A0A1A8ZTM2_PLAOA|nr:hypothetical protein POVWA1_055280 [Plasmodium ovale wallikeri]SBT47939.1 hypothetical protein POVWA2_054980 [Plasmodium ovale wallikeri]